MSPSYAETEFQQLLLFALKDYFGSSSLLELLTENCFFDFLRGTVIPNMNPFDGLNRRSVMVMDNCSIHHVPEVIELLEDTGILFMFLPPYSPDLNPLEETFSSIKYFIQDHDELLQATDDPKSITRSAFDNITKEQCYSIA